MKQRKIKARNSVARIAALRSWGAGKHQKSYKATRRNDKINLYKGVSQ